MQFIAKLVVLAGLFATIGCTNTQGEIRPDQTQAKRLKNAKPLEDDSVPESVAKLLPKEQVDARNSHAQAQAMLDQLEREKSQLERTESAKRD